MIVEAARRAVSEMIELIPIGLLGVTSAALMVAVCAGGPALLVYLVLLAIRAVYP